MKTIDFTLKEVNNGIFISANTINDKWRNCINVLKECYQKKINEDELINDKTIEYLEAGLFSMSKKSNKNTEELELLGNYEKMVNNLMDGYFYHNNPLVFTSRIFYEEDIYRNNMFSMKTNQRLTEARKKFANDSKNIYNKFMNNNDLTFEESRILSTYMLMRIDDERANSICESYYDKIVSSGKSLNRFELKFVLNQGSKKDWDLKSERPEIYITSDFENNGVSYGDTKTIKISSRFINEPYIKKDEDKNFVTLNNEANIHETHGSASVLYHEIQHQRQAEQVSKKFVNKTSFYYTVNILTRNYLSTSAYDEYKRNYMHKEIENECNMIGSMKARLESERLNLGCENTFGIRQQYYKTKFSKGWQKDKNGQLYYNISYNIEMLEKIIKDHPDVYNKYPVLSEFFYPNGKLKDLKDFVKQYTKISTTKQSSKVLLDMYDYIFKYYILNRERKNISFDLSQFNNNDDELSLMILLSNFTENESRSLKDFFDSLDVSSMNGRKEYIAYARKKMKVLKSAMINIIKAKQNGDIDRLLFYNDSKGFDNKRLTKFGEILSGSSIRTVAYHVRDNNLIKNDLEFQIIADEIDDFGKQMQEHEDYYDGLQKVIDAKRKYSKIYNQQM